MKDSVEKPENNITDDSMAEILQTIRGVISGENKEKPNNLNNDKPQDNMSKEEQVKKNNAVADNLEDEILELTEIVAPEEARKIQETTVNHATNQTKTIEKESDIAKEKLPPRDILTDIDNAVKNEKKQQIEPKIGQIKEIETSSPSNHQQGSNIPTEKILSPEKTDSNDKTQEDKIEAQPEQSNSTKLDDNKIIPAEVEEKEAQKAKQLIKQEQPIQTDPSLKTEEKNIINKNKEEDESLISPEKAKESAQALKNLISTVSKTNSSDNLIFRSGITLEELVIESLKPYLSNWLNNHLPEIVKDLVEKEIKRLIPDDKKD